jgi:hypothetical protein
MSLAFRPVSRVARAARIATVGARVLEGLSEYEDGLEHESMELGMGEVGGLASEVFEVRAELVVFHPPVEVVRPIFASRAPLDRLGDATR